MWGITVVCLVVWRNRGIWSKIVINTVTYYFFCVFILYFCIYLCIYLTRLLSKEHRKPSFCVEAISVQKCSTNFLLVEQPEMFPKTQQFLMCEREFLIILGLRLKHFLFVSPLGTIYIFEKGKNACLLLENESKKKLSIPRVRSFWEFVLLEHYISVIRFFRKRKTII